jgi:glycine betaine transporter
VLDQFPLRFLTIAAVVVAAFLFIVTSVVSAAFVLGMFSTGGDLNPSTRVKLRACEKLTDRFHGMRV